jgi:hypothetical protein
MLRNTARGLAQPAFADQQGEQGAYHDRTSQECEAFIDRLAELLSVSDICSLSERLLCVVLNACMKHITSSASNQRASFFGHKSEQWEPDRRKQGK